MKQLFILLQTDYPPYGGDPYAQGISTGMLIFILIAAVLQIAGMWKAFEKAGEPGWAAIIPIYNIYVVTKIAQKPGWWVLLFLIPIVNIIIGIMLYIAFSEKYGKGTGFALGLMFLGLIFWPILGFGNSQYLGNALHQEIDQIGTNS